MGTARLIVASTRLPVTLSRKKESWDVVRSAGGLVTALAAVRDQRPFIWLGWPGTHVPEGQRQDVTRELTKHGCAPVYISQSEMEGFYENCSNRVLWPLFHNLTERSHFDLAGWVDYQNVNQMFADAIVELMQPGDVIWIHDYQLMLVPEMLRRRGVDGPIGFFLHIPFPSAETYRTLPAREAILRGLLGADLIGFHSYEYVAHFRAACLRVLGLESEPESLRLQARSVHLGVLPIGLDPDEVQDMLRGNEAQSELNNLRASYAGKKIILGVDRLDYTKGIPEKLRAFEELLRQYPKWRSKVVLIQVAAPSRTGVDEYQQLKRHVDELVGRINGRFGSSSSIPVVYLNQSVRRERLMGMYRAADVALVTPVRDGMNLVALEYVAARRELGGTLILSEFTGAAHCLAGAHLVNPFNAQEVADALVQALSKDEPPPESFQHMLRFVDENTSMVWATRFLERLEATASEPRQVTQLLRMDEEPLLSLVQSAERPLVLLDYDGTLRSYVTDPTEAEPDEPILSVLRALSEWATVYVVSGRSSIMLDHWLGRLPIGLVCEHGLAIKPPGGQWQNRTQVSGEALTRLVAPIFKDFVRRTPGSSIEYKKAAVAWHYRAADPEYALFQSKELLAQLEEALRRRPYKVLRGARVIEVRHQSITKGQALLDILKYQADADFLFCAGDDRTDEEMMEGIPETWRSRSITCWVGSRNPVAQYWRESNIGLIVQLQRMVALWKEARAESGLRGLPRKLARSAAPR